MFDLDLIALSKIVALMIFFPIYLGFLGYAFWRPNKEKLQAHALIPFREE